MYQFQCEKCPAVYTRDTNRALKPCINENMTKKNLQNVNTYQETLKHECAWKNVKILDTKTKYRKRLISEMINFKVNKNSINKKENINLFNTAYFPVLRAFKFKN